MAARFWIGGGTSTAWNASPSTNWSATSGGTVRVAAPTAADDVTFDGVGTNANTACVLTGGGPTCLSITFTSGYTNTITINTAVNLTVAGNFTDNAAHTWIVNGTGALVISAASTITANGKTFPGPVTFSNTNTKTITGNWTITGTLSQSLGTPVINGSDLTIGGGISFLTAGVSGTSKLIFNGTGTITTGGAAIQNNVDINTSGTITIGTNFYYSTGTLKYISGTIVGGAAPGLNIFGSCTLDLAGVTWPLITLGVNATVTLSSLLTATQLSFTGTGTLTITFAGSFGWMCTTLPSTNNAFCTIALVNGVTYTIIDTFTAVSAVPLSSASNKPLFTSDHATLRANLVLLNDRSTCNVVANFTRINASGGRTIVSFNGIITDCINVATFSNVLYKPAESFDRGRRRLYGWNKDKSVIYQ